MPESPNRFPRFGITSIQGPFLSDGGIHVGGIILVLLRKPNGLTANLRARSRHEVEHTPLYVIGGNRHGDSQPIELAGSGGVQGGVPGRVRRGWSDFDA